MRSSRILIIIVTIIIISAINSQSKSTESSNNLKKLSEQGSIYITLAKDLMEMARAHSGKDTEFQAVYLLSTAASEADDCIEAASDLLFIYDLISNPADRILVRLYINKRINDYASRFDFLIKQTNTSLSFSISSGVAATGIRLRDELRGGQNLLKSCVIK
jgi:hypothetical protein